MIKTNVFHKKHFFWYFSDLFCIFFVFYSFSGRICRRLAVPSGFLSDHCSTPPQATVMQGRPVDVDTVAKFGSMYKSPRVMHQL